MRTLLSTGTQGLSLWEWAGDINTLGGRRQGTGGGWGLRGGKGLLSCKGRALTELV